MVGNDRHAPGNVLQFVIRDDRAIFNHAFHRRSILCVNMLGPVFHHFQGTKLSVTIHCNTNVNGRRLGNTGKATFRKTLLDLFANQRSLFAFRHAKFKFPVQHWPDELTAEQAVDNGPCGHRS